MRKLIDRILRRFGYVKQVSYRLYVKDTNWIQVVVSPQRIDCKTVDGHRLPISELAIYESDSIELEDKIDVDRIKDKDLIHWYNMGDRNK